MLTEFQPVRIAPPDLAPFQVGGITLWLLEALDFSNDGRLVVVRATYTDSGDPGSPPPQNYAAWIYDVRAGTYGSSINGIIAGNGSEGDYSVRSAVVSGNAASQTIVAEYALRGATDGFKLALIVDGQLVSADIIADFVGAPVDVPIENFLLSADGRFLAVQTSSEKLDLFDSNDTSDIYLLDLQQSAILRVTTAAGAETFSPASLADLQVDGGSVKVVFVSDSAFQSSDENGGSLDEAARADAYAWTVGFNAAGWVGAPNIALVSTGLDGKAAGYVKGGFAAADITRSGTFFASDASNIVADDANAALDVFLSRDGVPAERVLFAANAELSSDTQLVGASESGRLVALMTDDAAVVGPLQTQQLVLLDRQTGDWAFGSGSAEAFPQYVINGVLAPDGSQVAFTATVDELNIGENTPLSGELFILALTPPTEPLEIEVINRAGEPVAGAEVAIAGGAATETFYIVPQLTAEGLELRLMLRDPGGINSLDFDLTSTLPPTTFIVGELLAGWTAEIAQPSADTVSYSGFGPVDESGVLPMSGDHLLMTVVMDSRPTEPVEISISGAALGGAPVGPLDFVVYAGSSDANGSVVVEVIGESAAVTGYADELNNSQTRAITSQDALEAIRLAVGLPTTAGSLTPFDLVAADFNQDGRVSSQDALEILKFAVGVPDALPSAWVMLDNAADYSQVSRTNVSYLAGSVDASPAADSVLSFTLILVGDVNNSYVAPQVQPEALGLFPAGAELEPVTFAGVEGNGFGEPVPVLPSTGFGDVLPIPGYDDGPWTAVF